MNMHSGSTSVFTNTRNRNVISSAKNLRARSNQSVYASYTRSAWKDHLNSKFTELLALEPGWDGYQGEKLNLTILDFTLSLLEDLYCDGLSAPSVIPGSDGTIQLEWHQNGYDVEIDVLNPYDISACRKVPGSEDYEDVDVEKDISILLNWMTELKHAEELAHVG